MGLYYLICITNAFFMCIFYLGANGRGMDDDSLELDMTSTMKSIKKWAVKLFIPTFIFNTCFYMIPSLVLSFFSSPNISYALILSIFPIVYLGTLYLLRDRIIEGWKNRLPIHTLFDKIEKESNWVSFVVIYVILGSTVTKIAFDFTAGLI